MRYWPGENPVGKHWRISRDMIQREVVGVVADVNIQHPSTRQTLKKCIAQRPEPLASDDTRRANGWGLPNR